MDTTSVYADIVKHERNEDGDLVVYGRATGPDLDLDQQICDKSWLAEAMPAWFRSGANVREQHSPIAAGVGTEITETSDGGWDLKALVVDPVSARKVERGVLKGYSIGIRNPKVVKDAAAPGGRVVQGSIVEVSLVDRPANPTCQLMLAKAAKPGMTVAPGDLDAQHMLVKVEELHEAPDTLLKVVDAPDSLREAVTAVAQTGNLDVAAAKRQFSDQERQRLAGTGAALPDGSFPIRTVGDLRNAIHAIGRAKDPEKAKAHIKARARALGRTDLIPDSWKSVTADTAKAAPDGMWVHDPNQLAQVRNHLVALIKAELDELDDGDHELADVSELLSALSLFLCWWDSEAAGGETTSPYSGDDNNSGGPLMAVNLSAEADATKNVNPAAPAGVCSCGEGCACTTQASKSVGPDVEKATPKNPAKPKKPVSEQTEDDEDDDDDRGEDGMAPEKADIPALVKDAVNAAVAPLLAQLAAVKAAGAPETPAEAAEKASEADSTTPDVTELVKATVAEAIAPLREQIAKAMSQPAPGGPVLTRTTQATQKAAANEALLDKAAHFDRLAREVTDRSLADGYRELAKKARAEAAN